MTKFSDIMKEVLFGPARHTKAVVVHVVIDFNPGKRVA
jgi:hypothetical protein